MSPDVIRLLVLILIFGTVVLGTEGLVSWIRGSRGLSNLINKRLQLIASGRDRAEVLTSLRREVRRYDHLPSWIANAQRSLDRTIHGAGLVTAPGRILLLMGVAVVAIISIALLIAAIVDYPLTLGGLLLIATFAFSLGFGIPILILSKMSDTRHRKIEAQFPVALDVFVRGLRAGHPIASALELLTREMSDPIGSEFGIVVDEVTYGAELRDALQAMAERWDMDDMRMFVVCLSVQHETGGNLAEILENLSGVIRERASLFMKVRALSSEGRMTALILTLLPISTFTLLFMGNPGFYLAVARDPAFIKGFVTLMVLYFIGVFSIRRMIDLEV